MAIYLTLGFLFMTYIMIFMTHYGIAKYLPSKSWGYIALVLIVLWLGWLPICISVGIDKLRKV